MFRSVYFFIAVKLLLYVTNLAYCSMKAMAIVYTGVHWESPWSVAELEGEGGKIPQVITQQGKLLTGPMGNTLSGCLFVWSWA